LGRCPKTPMSGPPTPLLKYLLYLLWDRTRQLSFVKAKAHGNDVNNNIMDKLANEGRVSGQPLDIGALEVPAGWVDTAPVLCHQPLDYLTRLVIRHWVQSPTETIRFRRFLDRWTVILGNIFSKILHPGKHIGNVWKLHVPEGLKEVLWKEMNGALVLGHRYFGTSGRKSNMGWVCSCGREMSLSHILVGCGEYDLQPLSSILLDSLQKVSPKMTLKTLHLDEWGTSPWYPLLALQALEHNALHPFKGLKAITRKVKESRPQREWLIGSYFWALWKWRMKEIHDDTFRFVPISCADSLERILLEPCPVPSPTQAIGGSVQAPRAKTKLTDGAYD